MTVSGQAIKARGRLRQSLPVSRGCPGQWHKRLGMSEGGSCQLPALPGRTGLSRGWGTFPSPEPCSECICWGQSGAPGFNRPREWPWAGARTWVCPVPV